VNSLILTEKQQEVLWMRYGRRASLNQIAKWLNISRRAVLTRLRNARRRTERAGLAFPQWPEPHQPKPKPRFYSASQLAAAEIAGGLQMDEV
jgi:hypothetical protein